MRKKIKALPWMEIGGGVVFVALIGTFVYGAVTGATITTDTHYTAVGRIFQGVCAVGLTLIGLRTLTTLRRVSRAMREAQEGIAKAKPKEDDAPSIEYGENDD